MFSELDKIVRSHAFNCKMQNGRTEFAWIMRHKDPLQCGVGATLRWLLWRFEFLEGGDYPDFSERQAW